VKKIGKIGGLGKIGKVGDLNFFGFLAQKLHIIFGPQRLGGPYPLSGVNCINCFHSNNLRQHPKKSMQFCCGCKSLL